MTGAQNREGDVRVQLAEEELDVVKREREVGEVRIHKDVEVETKTIDVPVRKERVTVERVPASATGERASEAAFSGEDIVIPVREEEVEVTKRPVVKEELRVKKERWEDSAHLTEQVRKERAEVRADADVETEGEVSRGWNPDDAGKTRY